MHLTPMTGIGVALLLLSKIPQVIKLEMTCPFSLLMYMYHYLKKLYQNVITIILGVIYRPNTFPLDDIDIFNNSLLAVMDQIHFENKKGVIMGDMNINMVHMI